MEQANAKQGISFRDAVYRAGRAEMLKVIGAGFARTGTTSLKAALEQLGFGPCYHMFEILTHPDHVDRWLPAASDMPMDWDQVFDGYQSAVDWPASYFWREQAAAYPDAKVILTVRDAHRWYASFNALLTNAPVPSSPAETPEALPPPIQAMVRMRPVLDKIGMSTFGASWHYGAELDERLAVEAYHRHVATVRESLPAARLLVFDVRPGWAPLCEFLDVAAPTDVPFPHLNDSATLQDMFRQMATEGRVATPFD